MPDELEKFVLGDTAISAIEQGVIDSEGTFWPAKKAAPSDYEM